METVGVFSEPGSPLPPVKPPFGALLDADDEVWADDSHLRKASNSLFEAGCRWIVCFGERSEDVHDRIDDFIVEQSVFVGCADYEGIVTTFHNDESVAEVAEFFVTCALREMRGALILVQDKEEWAAALSRVTA